MSIKWMSAVWESGPVDKAELIVLLALADFADDAGNCWPSMPTIGRKARMSERNARRVIRKLEDDGYIQTVAGGGRYGCSQYRINPDKMSPGQNVPTGQNEQETRTKRAQNPDIAMSAKPSKNHQEPSEEPLLVSPRRKQAIPPNWVPSDRNVADATARQFSAQEIDDEAARFRDYHLAKGSTFKDWDAAWRTWLGNSRRFAPKRPDNSSAFLRSVARAAGAF